MVGRRFLHGLGVGLAAWILLGSNCRQGNELHPETLRNQVACKDYLEKQDLDAAETRCKLCLEYDRANPECLNGLGLVAYLRGNCKEAREFYKRAMRSRPEFPEARNNMGVCEMDEEDYKDAITLFESSIKIDPGYQDGRMNLAECHRILGDKAFAAAQVRVRDRGINTGDPNQMQSTFSGAEEHYALADEQLKRLVELNPTRFKAYAVTGYIEMQRSNYDIVTTKKDAHLERARDMSQRCIETAPIEVPDAKFCRGNLAVTCEHLGNFELAMTWWQSCLALDPKEPQCVAGFNRAYAGFSARAGGLKKYIDQISANPGYAQGHFNLCVAAFEMGLSDIAAASCENAIQLDKDLCLAHYQLGKHYRTVLNQDKAVGYCKSFITCTGTQNPAEVQECKDLIATLETP